MTRNLRPIDLYGILYRMVKGWPPSELDGVLFPCKQLQTFAYLTEEAQLNSSSLGKDPRYAMNQLFYSRKWEDSGYNPSAFAFDLPALYLWNQGLSDQSLGDNSFQMTYTFCFAMQEEGTATAQENPCFGWTNEEREQALLEFFQATMSELRDIVQADFNLRDTGDGAVPGYSVGFSGGFDSFGAFGLRTATPFQSGYGELGLYTQQPYDNPRTSYDGRWVSRSYLERMQTAGLIQDVEIIDELNNYFPNVQNSNGEIARGLGTMAPLCLLANVVFEFPNCVPAVQIDYEPALEGLNVQDQ